MPGPTSSVSIQYVLRGPVLKGLSRPIVEAACRAGQDAVAKEATNRIHARLHEVLKHPTGYYESQITTDLAQAEARIGDGGVIYGPWLEGVGSRNKTTRFKGYFTFRRVTAGLRRDGRRVAAAAMDPILMRLNG